MKPLANSGGRIMAIDQAVTKALADAGDQSASLAIVKDGQIAFAKADGTGTHYAFGIGVGQMPNGHRRWTHTGGVPGFASGNIEKAVEKLVMPDGQIQQCLILGE